MLLALALLAQATPPVAVRLGSTPVPSGAVIPVHVQAPSRGHLLVLRATTDGRVLPLSTTHLAAIRADEPSGTGMVIAAFSATPFRIDELDPRTSWWAGTAGAGALVDLVRLLAGHDAFEYDIAIYTIGDRRPRAIAHAITPAPPAPPASAAAPMPLPQPIVVVVQAASPQPAFETVILAPPRRMREPRAPRAPPRTAGICQSGVDCPPGTGTPAKVIRFR